MHIQSPGSFHGGSVGCLYGMILGRGRPSLSVTALMRIMKGRGELVCYS